MNARDYKHTAPRSSSKTLPRQGSWVSFVSGLGLGLLVALTVYLWQGELRPPAPLVQNAVPATDTAVPVERPAAVAAETSAALEPPRPKFDFYKILPEMEVPVQDWESAQEGSQQDAAADTGTYVLQVGSFKQFEDADRAKAKLALRGITANIQRVVINGQDVWFRVHVGPLSDVAEIRAMRTKLIENDTDFILLRIGGAGPA